MTEAEIKDVLASYRREGLSLKDMRTVELRGLPDGDVLSVDFKEPITEPILRSAVSAMLRVASS